MLSLGDKRPVSLTSLKQINNFALYVGALAGALLFMAVWILVGEPWQLFGDAVQYLRLHDGKIAEVPFGFRVFTPFLARLLPFSTKINFAVVTLCALLLVNVVIVRYSRLKKHTRIHAVVFVMLWLTSFAFVYYGTTWIRADAPMLLLLAIVILITNYQAPIYALAPLFFLGILAHETMLIGLVILWLDKLFGGFISGGQKYSCLQLGVLTFASVLLFVLMRLYLPAEPAAILNYSTNLTTMFNYVLDYSGGIVKHFMRIYAAFGPVMIYSFYYVITHKKPLESIYFANLFLAAVAATFVATDTLRVMAILFFPMLYYAAGFFEELWKSGDKLSFWLGLAVQFFYSFIVYGHLRTFETSFVLILLAVQASIAALLLVSFHLYKWLRSTERLNF